MKSANIKLKNEQKKVKYKFDGGEIEGRQDVENAQVIEAYNKAKNKSVSSTDTVDAKIVEEISEDSPEEILAS
jgi:hypothetical protein